MAAKKGKKGDGLLTESLTSLNKELDILRKKKKSFELKLGTLSKRMVEYQNQELKLRDEISALVKDEASINTNKEYFEKQLSKLKSKMAEVSKIKDELSKVKLI
ncbi:hypothetical protein J4212_02070 [Candidatus Woesearchaeota archaeon]|nr:hypothetical protein [Candidatus Woesearchaeota archaeon]